MVNTIEHDHHSARSGCLIATATVLLTLVTFVAAMACVVTARGFDCDIGCDDHVNGLIAASPFVASGAVLLGGALAWVTASWRFYLLGAAFAALLLLADLAIG